MNIEKLYAFAPRARVLENEPLARHTTFRVGGPADVLFLPESAQELQQAMELAREAGEDCLVIGNGSNLLVRDGGVRGLVIKLAGPMSGVSVEGTAIRAQAGASLSQVSRAALQASLTGLEFASGIPGSLGGALAMNAGAYGGELSQVVREAMVLMDGRVQTLSREELAMGYRTTRVLREGGIVLSAVLDLKEGDAPQIAATMDDLNRRRREKQPLSFPSAGSTFKRPEGYFAGALIEQAGLKGYAIGGAQVSEKHAGFLINRGGATASDLLRLIEYVQERVYAQSGVRLETEVRICGVD
ncbi:MAG: UDP-N-acetylmuramate dehydrogenase [bacterium]|nr:UDP-N-acetylmuramate dehydrogenase [bacterium]